jgi:hypothetical protein
MRADAQDPVSPGPAPAAGPARLPRQLAQGPRSHEPGLRPAPHRGWIAAAWTGGALALFAFLVRISLGSPTIADGANPALQAWDLLHGQLLLHGWIIADANYYPLELPLYAVSELLAGFGELAGHVGAALTYLIVAACAVALAGTASRGVARAARCGVVIAVLAAPLVMRQGVAVLVEEPDHIGTAAFLLGSFLLIDRAPGRRFTAPLLCGILWAGQVGDATVRYIAVPAVLAVCAYRIVAARKLRPGTAIAAAAAASVPLSLLTRALMQHAGAYATVPPPSRISPVSQWPQHAVVTLHAVLTLFGAGVPVAGSALAVAAASFGLACLAAAAAGFAKAVWTWRTASWAGQLASVTIVVNLAVYAVSALPNLHNSREIAAVLPCGAVLAARAWVPGRIAGALRARAALAAAAAAALLPLAAAATRPPATPASVPLAGWLRAHGLRYGIAGYWDASPVTLESGNRVQVRAVTPAGRVYHWEAKTSWYNASRHDATFAIAGPPHAWPTENLTATDLERRFGRPAAIRAVAGREILIYRTNLLQRVGRPPAP